MGRQGSAVARALIVAALLATSADGRAEPLKTDAPPACPSFGDLGRRVDERVKAIRPGVTLAQFTKEHATPALNFWDAVGSDRETVFFVGVADGNAQVSDEQTVVLVFEDVALVSKKMGPYY
jgi:hypothetical protein